MYIELDSDDNGSSKRSLLLILLIFTLKCSTKPLIRFLIIACNKCVCSHAEKLPTAGKSHSKNKPAPIPNIRLPQNGGRMGNRE